MDRVLQAFQESVEEMQAAGFLPEGQKADESDSLQLANAETPPVPGAKLGRDLLGNPAWFIKDPDKPGKYLQVGGK
jgi:hypothetical protein